MKRANTMSTITVELTIKVKTKFTSSNAENTKWIHLTTDVKFSHMSMHQIDCNVIATGRGSIPLQSGGQMNP